MCGLALLCAAVVLAGLADVARLPAAYAQPYPLCPLTGKAPVKSTPPFTRCLDANTASCCGACADIRYGLGLVTASTVDIVTAVLPAAVALLPPGSDLPLCEALVQYSSCTLQIEQLLCAGSCNPDSGNFVVANGDGTYNLTLCSAYATAVFDTCSSLAFNGISITTIVSTPEALIDTLLKALSSTAQLPMFAITIAEGTSSTCYGGPTKAPAADVCCDPLTFPSGCPAAATNISSNPEWAAAINRTITNATCASSSPSGGSPPPSPPAGPPANTTGNNSSSGLCPLTGLPPTKPNITVTRCSAATELTCCSDCTDLRLALTEVAGNVTDIVGVVSSAIDLGSGSALQLCSVFANYPDCEHELEQMVCATSCNPDSARYITPITTANGSTAYQLNVCDAFASTVYELCKDLSVPGVSGTLGSFLNTKAQFLSLMFGGITAKLELPSFTTNVVKDTDMCYNGSTARPATTTCCDPLVVPSGCPPSVINFTRHPEFLNFSGRQVDPIACNTTSVPISAPSATAPPSGKSGASLGPGQALALFATSIVLLGSWTSFFLWGHQ